jgi:hypothetical protein
MSSIETLERRATDSASRPRLRLLTSPPVRTESSWAMRDDETIELKLGFRELVLIHRSLQAIRTLDLVERKDDLLIDTLQLIDVALQGAVTSHRARAG